MDILQVDVSNRSELLATLPPRRRATVTGIIHAAGIIRDSPLEKLDWLTFLEVLKPKSHGAYNLHQLFAEKTLSIFCMFSSCSAIFGSPKQCGYLAGNSFMDSLAHMRSEAGLSGQSLAWSAWGEVGMARDLPLPMGMAAIPVAMATQALRQVLAVPTPYVMLARLDWDAFIRNRAQPCLQHLVATPNVASKNVTLQAVKVQDLELLLRGILCEFVGQLELTDLDTGFMELGIDSLDMQHLATRISAETQIPVSWTEVFAYSSCAQLARFLASRGGVDQRGHVQPLETLHDSDATRPALDTLHFTADVAVAPGSFIGGVACRYPGNVNRLDEMWQVLVQGQDCVSSNPPCRWEPSEEIYNGSFAYVKDPEMFDAAFFNIPPAAAQNMDPQARWLLEEVHHALEDGGEAASIEQETITAVFTGFMTSDYLQLVGQSLDKSIPTGTMRGILPGHISHFFNFKGASMSTNTACSSSLVALDRGKLELEAGRCTRVVAAAANVILSRELMIQACRMKMLSKSGRCRSFDQDADGYVRGEGCGVIILHKNRPQASRAALSGSSVVHDGRSSALTVPNWSQQEEVIKRAMCDCPQRVSAVDVEYLEAHGTGTPKGDPLEMKALCAVFEDFEGRRTAPLLVSTAKTTFGHLEAASGIIGVHRALCCLRFGSVPRHISLKKLSAAVQAVIGNSNWCHIVGEPVPWSALGQKTAGVSSFGLSGTNSHCVLHGLPEFVDSGMRSTGAQHAVRSQAQALPPVSSILVLSAASPHAFELQKAKYHAQLECVRASPGDLWSFCIAAATGRRHMQHRFAAAGSSKELKAALTQPVKPTESGSNTDSVVRLEVGAQNQGKHAEPSMWHDLYEQNVLYRDLREQGVPEALAVALLLRIWGLEVRLAGAGAFAADLLEQLQKIVNGPSMTNDWHYHEVGKVLVESPSEAQNLSIQRVEHLGEAWHLLSVTEGVPVLLSMLARAYVQPDSKLNWVRIASSFGVHTAKWSDLPLYEFDRKRHWYLQANLTVEFKHHDPETGALWFAFNPKLDGALRVLLDHRLRGQAILPAAAHVEVLQDACLKTLTLLGKAEGKRVVLEEVTFRKPLFLQDACKLQIKSSLQDDHVALRVFAAPSELLCTVRAYMPKMPLAASERPRQLGGDILHSDRVYERLSSMGPDYQGHFKVIDKAEARGSQVWAELQADAPSVSLLDGALQALALAGMAVVGDSSAVPMKISHVEASESLTDIRHVYAVWSSRPSVKCWDDSGRLVAKLESIEVKEMQSSQEMKFFGESWMPANSALLGLTDEEQKNLGALDFSSMKVDKLHDQAELQQTSKLNDLALAYAVPAMLSGRLNGHFKLREKLQATLARSSDPLAKAYRHPSSDVRMLNLQQEATNQILRRSQSLPSCPEKALLCKCGDGLLKQQAALEPHKLLFPLAEQVYSDGISSKAANRQMGQQVSAMLAVAPQRTKVLEIGAGTGATARAILQDVARRGLAFPLQNYVFTDLSKRFLSAAKELGVSTRLLDIQKDPASQGFVPHSFNIVVCTNVLHATKSLETTLHHVWRLCAPNAVLVLSETVKQDLWLDLTFGLLPEWWQFQDRQGSPLLPIETWKVKLAACGFEPAFAAGATQAVILARAVDTAGAPRPVHLQDHSMRDLSKKPFWLLLPPIDKLQEFSRHLSQVLKRAGEDVVESEAGTRASRLLAPLKHAPRTQA